VNGRLPARPECLIFLAGEGVSDIGDLANEPPYRGDQEGFLQPIVRKLAGDGITVRFTGQRITLLGRKQRKSRGFAAKARRALPQAAH
jgi:hypothetical protein